MHGIRMQVECLMQSLGSQPSSLGAALKLSIPSPGLRARMSVARLQRKLQVARSPGGERAPPLMPPLKCAGWRMEWGEGAKRP